MTFLSVEVTVSRSGSMDVLPTLVEKFSCSGCWASCAYLTLYLDKVLDREDHDQPYRKLDPTVLVAPWVVPLPMSSSWLVDLVNPTFGAKRTYRPHVANITLVGGSPITNDYMCHQTILIYVRRSVRTATIHFRYTDSFALLSMVPYWMGFRQFGEN